MTKPATKTMSLASLSQLWLIQKEAENQAHETRLLLEEQISHWLDGPDEGTVSKVEGGLRATITRKFNRVVDMDAYRESAYLLPASLDPVVMKPTLDLKKYRALEAANAEVFKVVQKFVEVRPAKSSVKIEEVSND